MPAEIQGLGAGTGTAVADTGSVSGADNGSSDSGNQTADTGVDESGSTNEGLETSADTEVHAGDENVDESSTDEGNKGLPSDIRKLYEQLKTSDPKLAKQIRGLYFENKELKTQFPGGLAEAVKAKEIVDSLGGEEGLASIEAERNEWNALDELFSKGDPAFVTNIADVDPEAFTKLVPTAISELAKRNPEQYQHLMGKVVLNTIDSSPIGAIYQELAKYAETKPFADKLADWYNQIHELATKVPEKKVDAERLKLDQERQAFNAQKAKEFVSSVGKEALTWAESEVDKELTTLAGKIKLETDDKNLLLANIGERMSKRFKQSPLYKQYQTSLATGNKTAAIKLAKQILNQGLKEDVKYIFDSFSRLGSAKAAPKTAPAKKAANTTTGGVVKLTKAPDPTQVDRSRTTNDMLWQKKAYIKGQTALHVW